MKIFAYLCMSPILIHYSTACFKAGEFISPAFPKTAFTSVTVFSDNFRNISSDCLISLYDYFGTIHISSTINTSSKVNIIISTNESYLLNSLTHPTFWKPGSFYLLNVTLSNAFYTLNYLWTTYKVSNVFLGEEEEKNCVKTINPLKKLIQKICASNFRSFTKVCSGCQENLFAVGFQREHALNFNEDGSVSGYNAKMMSIIGSALKCNITIKPTSDKRRYGAKVNGTFIGSFKDIMDRRAEISANGHFVKWYGIPELSFTHYITGERLCIFVPKAQKIPHLLAVLKSIDIIALFVTFLTALILTLINTFFRHFAHFSKKTIKFDFLTLYGVILGIPVRCKPNAIHEIIILGSFYLMSFVIVSYIQSALITSLSAPVYYKNINTLEELRNSRIEIWLSSQDMSTTLSLDENLAGLNIQLKTQNESFAGNNREDIGRIFRINIHFDPRNVEYIGEKAINPRHIIRECLGTYLVAYVIKADYTAEERINEAIARIIESGHFAKWIKTSISTEHGDLKFINKKVKLHIFKSLTGKDLIVLFFLSLFGYTGASVIFFLEILYSNVIKEKRNN